MSALPSIATKLRTSHEVADVPEATSQALFDHFVRSGEQFIWNGDAERLGGLEIYHKLKRRRLLDRQVAGFAPLKILSTYEAARRKTNRCSHHRRGDRLH